MSRWCEESERFLGNGAAGVEELELWRRHLAGCPSCREQAAADAWLRELRWPAPPEPAAGFRRRLRQRLEAEGPRRGRQPGRLRPAGLWALGAYGTAAAFASALVLARLPWGSLAMPPAMLLIVAALVLLAPLALLDRVGIVRPPG